MEEEKVTEQTLTKGKEMLELWKRITDGYEDAFSALSQYDKLYGLDHDEMCYLQRHKNKITVKLARHKFVYNE